MRRPRSGLATAIKAIAFLLAVAAIYFAKTVLLPVAIAVLLAFALAPVVRWLEKPLRFRPLAIVVAISLTAVVVAGMGTLAVVQARSFVEQSPHYREAIRERLRATRESAAAIDKAISDVKKGAQLHDPGANGSEASPATSQTTTPDTSAADVSTDLFSVAEYALHAASIVFITTLLLAVVLLNREDLRDRLVRILGVESLPLTRRTLDEASSRVSQFLLTQAMLNTVCGVLVGVGLLAMGVPSALLLGLTAGLLRFVPYLGILATATFAFLVALASFPNWGVPLGTLGVFAVVESLIAGVFEPWLYGRRTGLSLFGVVVAISFWGWLWGVPGLLVAVPLTVCIVLLARHFPALEPLSILLGDTQPLSPVDRFHHRLLSRDAAGARAVLQSLPIGDAEEDPDELRLASIRRADAESAHGRLSDDDLVDYIQAARDLEPMLSASGPDDAPAPTNPDVGELVLISSANPLDELAARIVQSAITRRWGARVRWIEPPVMISDLESDESTRRARGLVVLTVARASRKRARLMVRVLRNRFPEATIVLAALGTGRAELAAHHPRGVRVAMRIDRVASETGLPARPSIVAAGEAPTPKAAA